MDEKKRVFSGIQPSGTITLGNYLGAVKNWVPLQEEYECIFSIVDLHALTVRQEPAEFRKKNIEMMALVAACGVDERSLLFFQSHVPAHSELSWLLSCNTMFGELSRMTQFKDKSRRHADNINAGLFTYPVLMAADILLYNTDLVPIGEDQKQHLELARNIAERVNGVYGDIFKVPGGLIPKEGARIKSLADPTKKMSKSDDNKNAFIAVLDSPDDIRRKIKKAVTDSCGTVLFEEGRDGICNLINIYSAITGKKIKDIEAEFEGKGYGDFKEAVAESIIEEFRPIREKYDYIMKNRDMLEANYKKSAEIANSIAGRTVAKFSKKIGIIAR